MLRLILFTISDLAKLRMKIYCKAST